MATVTGDDAFARRQRSLFDGLRSLPLGSYELTADWGRVGDLARPSDFRRYRDAFDVALPITEERYTLEGVDERPAADDLFLTFVGTADGWRIAADDDLEDVGLFSSRRLWDRGPVTLERSGRFLLMEHPCGSAAGCADIPDDLLATANRSLRKVGRRLPSWMPRTVAIVAPASQNELGRMLQATYELDNFLAFATSSVDISEGVEFTGHRILLNWDQIRASPTGLDTLLTHELVHIASRRFAGPFTTTFVDEGIAENIAREDDPSSLGFLRAAIADGAFDRRLPEEHEFRTGGGERIFLSYKESQSAITFFIERWGRKAFLDFYRALGLRRVAAGTPRFHVDRALRASIGVGFAEFERAWADSIT